MLLCAVCYFHALYQGLAEFLGGVNWLVCKIQLSISRVLENLEMKRTKAVLFVSFEALEVTPFNFEQAKLILRTKYKTEYSLPLPLLCKLQQWGHSDKLVFPLLWNHCNQTWIGAGVAVALNWWQNTAVSRWDKSVSLGPHAQRRMNNDSQYDTIKWEMARFSP